MLILNTKGEYMNITGRYSASLFFALLLFSFACGGSQVKDTSPPCLPIQHLENAYSHLYEVMDQYNHSFDVYTDSDAGGNHYISSGWMGDRGDISFNANCTKNPHSGTTCIEIIYSAERSLGYDWASIYWQYPKGNWGDKGEGYDLSGASKLSFWARGEQGGEKAEFKVGGINRSSYHKPNRPYQDSFGPITRTVALTQEWREYTIDLNGEDLTNVIGGFCWATNFESNLRGCTIYLDDIKFDKERLYGKRFLNSYIVTASEKELALRNAAFTYDNALALLCFILRDTPEDRKRAKILADAFVRVQENEKGFKDGRLRNAYRSGDIIDKHTAKQLLPSWWDSDRQKWFEDMYQISTHTGNLAWVMIALLEYYDKYGGDRYLESAQRLGDWIVANTFEDDSIDGYSGGGEGWNTDETNNYHQLSWKSTEHNIDAYVAFMRLYGATMDIIWKERALHAKRFVQKMWNEQKNHFMVGTQADGATINTDVLPLDVNTWGLLALGEQERFGIGIDWALSSCKSNHVCPNQPSFEGFDFNDDKDGVWFEGTAQMALALKMIEREKEAKKYLSELEKAQVESKNNNCKGIVAACHDPITTGIWLSTVDENGNPDKVEWFYYNRLHVGATAWYIFAKEEYNPFWGIKINKEVLYEGIYD